jgi:glyoxylase-like metal-dependent hydrolase (beta-lactamase superfamily II)
VRKPTRPREIGRGEKVLPGVWRLRLPLPWPGVPHCNAYALAAGDGIVLVDCGMHEPGSMAHLERAMEQVGLRIEHVRLLVCTHAHGDHCGQAATIKERAGCELWIHPDHAHFTSHAADPEQAALRRLEVARQSGVPEGAMREWVERRRGSSSGLAGPLEPDRDLLPGVVVQSDLGPWEVILTPGHAPSHVSLYQRDRRVLLAGDHLLGRTALYFDYGYTPDPVGEFLASLDTVEGLGARLALSGHGRPFTDIPGHIDANRRLVRERLEAVQEAASGSTAYEIAERVYGEHLNDLTMIKTLCYLRHLEVTGRLEARDGTDARIYTRSGADRRGDRDRA